MNTLAPPRKHQTLQAPFSSRKSLRTTSTQSGSDLKAALLTVAITLMVSFIVLRQLDIFSSGEWPESEHIKYLLSDEDREAFQAKLERDSDGPLVLAFYSETCIACRRMRRHFLSCAEAVEGVPFYAAHVADKKNFDLATQFKIKRIPAILVLHQNGPDSLPTMYKGKPNRQQLIDFVKTATASQLSSR